MSSVSLPQSIGLSNRDCLLCVPHLAPSQLSLFRLVGISNFLQCSRVLLKANPWFLLYIFRVFFTAKWACNATNVQQKVLLTSGLGLHLCYGLLCPSLPMHVLLIKPNCVFTKIGVNFVLLLILEGVVLIEFQLKVEPFQPINRQVQK